MTKVRKARGPQRRPQPGAQERSTPVAEASSVAEVAMRLASPTAERVVPAEVPDPEVTARAAARRRFSAAYKLQILRTADACAGAGEVGTVLRREGLYSSHLTTWRRQRDAGSLAALAPKKRGRPAAASAPLARRIAELERDNAALTRRLHQAETIIEVQKKLCTLLGIPLPPPERDGSAS
jgi:transposase-like protein